MRGFHRNRLIPPMFALNTATISILTITLNATITRFRVHVQNNARSKIRLHVLFGSPSKRCYWDRLWRRRWRRRGQSWHRSWLHVRRFRRRRQLFWRIRRGRLIRLLLDPREHRAQEPQQLVEPPEPVELLLVLPYLVECRARTRAHARLRVVLVLCRRP